MRGTYQLVRELPVDKGFDIVVIGGGPAGTAAAVCAARLGASVLLVEATGCLGGMGTSGLVNAFDPMADGERMLVGGFMREVVETMYSRGFLRPGTDPAAWRKAYHRWTHFRCEGLKLILDEFVTSAGIEVRFFTRMIDVDSDTPGRHVRGVILNNVEGSRYVPAKCFVDATGDAALAALCGAPVREAGCDTERIMPATLASLHTGIDWDRYSKATAKEAIHGAIEEGHFSQPDHHLPGLNKNGVFTGYLNGGHIFNLDALRCRSLSDGMMLGRRIVQEYVEFYRKYVPGCENMELVTTASLMGVRESRRILGEYELNIGDYKARRHFPDQIGLFNKFIDIHPYDASPEEWARFQEDHRSARLGKGENFGIPYRILVPKGWKNLWAAGRCASSDVPVQGSIRVMPAAAMMGQAAGTAAWQSVRTNQPACGIDTKELVATLRAHGATLPEARK